MEPQEENGFALLAKEQQRLLGLAVAPRRPSRKYTVQGLGGGGF